MKLVLPAIINPPRIRKDGSASIGFDTRELSSEELFSIMQLRNAEGWLCFAPNENELVVPEDNAQVEGKTPSERQRAVLYILYTKEVREGTYVGIFDNYYRDAIERNIKYVKSKLND